jgi:hypothetical protein
MLVAVRLQWSGAGMLKGGAVRTILTMLIYILRVTRLTRFLGGICALVSHRIGGADGVGGLQSV